jgi:hypothetical protein
MFAEMVQKLNERPIPIIKERRIEYIVNLLKCFSETPFNRRMQKACIMKLYPDSTEQTAFRGIAIQTLRKLGLIVGRSDKIRLSSNGEIIVDSDKTSMKDRTIRAVILEIDSRRFHFIELIRKLQPLNYSNFTAHLQKGTSLGEKQLKERIDSWLGILVDSKLVACDKNGTVRIKRENFETANKDLQIEEKEPYFVETLLSCFHALYRYGTAGMVDIADLRSKVAFQYLQKMHMILTEMQFDQLLEKIPKVTDAYIITFGQPMGAEEQLFVYKGNYYRTINIKMLKKEAISE